MNNGLNKKNMLLAMPPALQHDPKMVALATTVASTLEQRIQEIQLLRIYSRIDELPEELLDILAYDFKVDWWDKDYTLAQKRQTLKDSWHVHRIMGTVAAVEIAISAVYRDTRVVEWWEYGGQPYHFKLRLNATYESVDPEKHQRVMERVRFYKNLRSILDEIEYYDAGGTADQYVAVAPIGYELVDGCTAVRYIDYSDNQGKSAHFVGAKNVCCIITDAATT